MSGSGQQSTTTVQRADPWGPMQPQLRRAGQTAASMFRQGDFAPRPFEGDRVAGFGSTTMQAQDMIRSMAGGGAPLVDSARGTLTNMMSGDYQSDLLDRVKQEALGSAIPAAVAQFSGAGMTNSGQAMDTVGRAATEAIAPIEYGAFQAGQNRALQAAQMAPSMTAAGYLPAQMMGQVGAAEDRMAQAEIDARRQFYDEVVNRERNNYQGYLDSILALGGLGGSRSGTSTEPGPSMGQTVASAGLGGLGTYGALAANPVTAPYALIGGIGSGLLGLL